MIIDFHMIANLKPVKDFMCNFDLNNFFTVFNLSVALYQLISNVPSAIFMSKFSNNYITISYGVNPTGNGVLTGYLANIIALRFVGDVSIYIKFHKYSIPFL